MPNEPPSEHNQSKLQVYRATQATQAPQDPQQPRAFLRSASKPLQDWFEVQINETLRQNEPTVEPPVAPPVTPPVTPPESPQVAPVVAPVVNLDDYRKAPPVDRSVQRDESPVHFSAHSHGQQSDSGFCAHCIAQLAAHETGAGAATREYIYQWLDAIFLALSWLDVRNLFKAKQQQQAAHQPEAEQTPQYIWNNSVHTAGSKFLYEAKELGYIALQGFIYFGTAVAVLVSAIAFFLAAMFPEELGPKNPKQLKEDDERREQRRKEHEERRAEREAYERVRDDDPDEEETWNRYSEDRHKIIKMAVHPVLDERNEILEDDHRVREVNDLVRKVEDGREDPRKLHEANADLMKSREKLVQRDGKRREAYGKYREKFDEGQKLLREADNKAQERKFRQANDLYYRADAVFRAADGHWCEYLAI